MRPEQQTTLTVDGLELEAMLRPGGGSLAAVVMHPHPQYGGDMNNHVVVAITEALADAEATTLRFNFRGTGISEGVFDGGRGEADDARAALRVVREHAPDAVVLLVGYSFGAMIASAAAPAAGLDGLALISPPLGMAELPPLPAGMPVLIVAGEQDPLSPATAVDALTSTDVETLVVPGADHGWWPGVAVVADATLAFGQKLRRRAT